MARLLVLSAKRFFTSLEVVLFGFGFDCKQRAQKVTDSIEPGLSLSWRGVALEVARGVGFGNVLSTQDAVEKDMSSLKPAWAT